MDTGVDWQLTFKNTEHTCTTRLGHLPVLLSCVRGWEWGRKERVRQMLAQWRAYPRVWAWFQAPLLKECQAWQRTPLILVPDQWRWEDLWGSVARQASYIGEPQAKWEILSFGKSTATGKGRVSFCQGHGKWYVACVTVSSSTPMYMTGLSRFQIQIIKDEDMNLRVGFGEGDFKKRWGSKG